MNFKLKVVHEYEYDIEAENEDEAMEIAREKSFDDVPESVDFIFKEDEPVHNETKTFNVVVHYEGGCDMKVSAENEEEAEEEEE